MLAQILKRYRKEKGLTQERLAEKLGVTRAALAKWETGEAHPTYKVLQKIAQIIPPCEIFVHGNHKKCECQEHNTTIYCVFPKMTVFCPAKQRERRGQECLSCEHYRGFKTCQKKGLFWIECAFEGQKE